jgi:hypothetical protein
MFGSADKIHKETKMKSSESKKQLRRITAKETKNDRAIGRHGKEARRIIKHHRRIFLKLERRLDDIFTNVQSVLPQKEFNVFMKSVGMKANARTGCFELPMP